MRRSIWLLVFVMFTLVGCETAQVRQVLVNTPKTIETEGQVRPVAISKVVAKIPRGTKIGKLYRGTFCLSTSEGEIIWGSRGKVNFTTEELVDVFRNELTEAGWPVVGTTENLFEEYDLKGAELLLGAKITGLDAQVCFPDASDGDWYTSSGDLYMKVEWQVFSPRTRKVLGIITTEGSSSIKERSTTTAVVLFEDSFAAATKNLLADPSFYDLVKTSGSAAEPATADTIVLTNPKLSRLTAKEAIEIAKKSVVTVRTANGHGSGFAVGDGGKVITNSHVVGEAKSVTIVTSDGISFTAKVLRTSRERDVALIDLGEITVKPLPINTAPFNAGSDLYAIGSPLDEKLSGTVTKGVYSGNRDYEHFVWLQSDVAVNPGNSGGPLLDENCNVVGISTLKLGDPGTNINLFVPIAEGLRYLSVELKPES